MVKERFVETYSQGVTNVRKISNFNRVDNQGATAKSAAALCHHKKQLSTCHNSLRREGGISYDLHRRIQRAYRVHIPRFL